MRRSCSRIPLLSLVVCAAGGCSAFQAPSNDGGVVTGTPVAPLAPATLAVGDALGTAVAASPAGDLIAVGAPGDDRAGPDAGAVYLFSAGAAGIGAPVVLVSDDPHEGDHFGAGLALSPAGDLLAVGIPGWDDTAVEDDAIISDAGAVQLFSAPAGPGQSWQPGALLTAPQELTRARFGASLTFAGADQLVVGAPGASQAGASAGAAYLFARQGETWSPL